MVAKLRQMQNNPWITLEVNALSFVAFNKSNVNCCHQEILETFTVHSVMSTTMSMIFSNGITVCVQPVLHYRKMLDSFAVSMGQRNI